MRNEILAELEELTAEVNRLGVLGEVLRKVEGKATSRDGLVTVTVGSEGRVLDIELSEGACDRLTSEELATSLMEQIGIAYESVEEQARELAEPHLPEGVTYDGLRNMGGHG